MDFSGLARAQLTLDSVCQNQFPNSTGFDGPLDFYFHPEILLLDSFCAQVNLCKCLQKIIDNLCRKMWTIIYKLPRGVRFPSYIRKTGERRPPDGLISCWFGLRRPVFNVRVCPVLFLREWDDRNVPCRDKENGLFDDMLPRLLLSCWDIDTMLGLFCDELHLRSIVVFVLELKIFSFVRSFIFSVICEKIPTHPRLNGINEFGLRRSDGERRRSKIVYYFFLRKGKKKSEKRNKFSNFFSILQKRYN